MLKVAVIGTGRLGLLVAQVLATTDCRLTAIGRNPKTLALLDRKRVRTSTVPELKLLNEYDLVVDCTGSPEGLPLAMKRPPSSPGPQPGDKTGQQVMHYPTYIQPVLDKHCVRCHGATEPAARLDLTGELTTQFSRSYENLMRRKMVPTYREFSDWEGSPYSQTHPPSVGPDT